MGSCVSKLKGDKPSSVPQHEPAAAPAPAAAPGDGQFDDLDPIVPNQRYTTINETANKPSDAVPSSAPAAKKQKKRRGKPSKITFTETPSYDQQPEAEAPSHTDPATQRTLDGAAESLRRSISGEGGASTKPVVVRSAEVAAEME